MADNIYFLTYDIDDNESELIDEIKGSGDAHNCLSNGWFIKTTIDEDKLYEKLQPYFANGKGRFLISKIQSDGLNGWISTETIDWLKKNLYE